MNFRSVLVIATLVVGGSALAQTGGAKSGGAKPPQNGQAGPRQGGPGGQFRMRTPEQRVERLSAELKLTADQKKKILALYKANAPKQKALMEDQKMSREQKMKAFEKMRDESNKKLNAILTKDQQKKFAEMRNRRGGQARPGQNRNGGPAASGAKAGGTKTGGKTKG